MKIVAAANDKSAVITVLYTVLEPVSSQRRKADPA
jgi:hypothetical protein